MRKKLKRKSVQRMQGIFDNGRLTFSKANYPNITYLGTLNGMRVYSAMRKDNIPAMSAGALSFDHEEATWG